MPEIDDSASQSQAARLPTGKVNIITQPSATDPPLYLQAPTTSAYPGEPLTTVSYYEVTKAPGRSQFEIKPFGDTGLYLIVNVANHQVYATFNAAEGLTACTRGASEATAWKITASSIKSPVGNDQWYISIPSAGGTGNKPIYAISYEFYYKQPEVRVVSETDMKANEAYALWTIIPA